MTTKANRQEFIDCCYEMRQDGQLPDALLDEFLKREYLSRFTYDLIRRLPIK